MSTGAIVYKCDNSMCPGFTPACVLCAACTPAFPKVGRTGAGCTAAECDRYHQAGSTQGVDVSAQDAINPPHYTTLKHEPIDVIEDWQQYWPKEVVGHLFNVVKYVARAGLKGRTVEDLKKARWYLTRAIQVLGGEAEQPEE